jgi:hypothetical protein
MPHPRRLRRSRPRSRCQLCLRLTLRSTGWVSEIEEPGATLSTRTYSLGQLDVNAQYCARMPGRNGRQSPPRPQIEIQSSTASPEEAAAIAAALERFLWETAPPPHAAEMSRWQCAALQEGVEARTQLGGNWGPC